MQSGERVRREPAGIEIRRRPAYLTNEFARQKMELAVERIARFVQQRR